MIAWGPDLYVGWEEIDAQHKEILVRLADLRDRVQHGDEFGAQAAMGALADTVVLHFATEQDLMDRTSYPERAAHQRAHELFLQDLHALAAELDEVGLTDVVNAWARVHMTEWLTFHIQTNDVPLGRHLVRLRQSPGTAPSATRSRQS